MLFRSHGDIISENLGDYIKKYDEWSKWQAEEDGVLIVCANAHFNTYEACEKLLAKLKSMSVKAELVSLNKTHSSYALALAMKYDRLVLATTTYDGGMFPLMESFLLKLKAKSYNGRKVGLIENGSWAPMSGKLMREALCAMKNIEVLPEQVTIRGALNDESEKQLDQLAQAIAKKN